MRDIDNSQKYIDQLIEKYKFEEEHIQLYIDELIAYGFNHNCRPEWFNSEDFLSSLSIELGPFVCDEINPERVLEDSYALSLKQDGNDRNKLIGGSRFRESEDVIIIFELESTDAEKYYTSILFSADYKSNCAGMILHDDFVISNKVFSVLKNEIIQRIRTMEGC